MGSAGPAMRGAGERNEKARAKALPETGALGRYELIRRIAIGGMAELFLARASGLKGFEKQVVVKRILPEYARDGEFIRMFLQEARLAATLHHANIVQVYDIGKVGETYFFTMEYVPGVDARRILKQAFESHKCIPLEHAISIVLGAAAGLHYAHEKRDSEGSPLGLVHRDVSPSNILVGTEGAVKVLDFGIAKATHERNETRPGSVKGKVSYMSPEQCAGAPLDRRSDIFALGILLYELTTTSALFAGETELANMRQILEQEIPLPSTKQPDYPKELERIVMRALRRDPSERYATAQELQRELERFAFTNRLPISALGLSEYITQLVEPPPTDAFLKGETIVLERTSAGTREGEAPTAARDKGMQIEEWSTAATPAAKIRPGSGHGPGEGPGWPLWPAVKVRSGPLPRWAMLLVLAIGVAFSASGVWLLLARSAAVPPAVPPPVGEAHAETAPIAPPPLPPVEAALEPSPVPVVVEKKPPSRTVRSKKRKPPHRTSTATRAKKSPDLVNPF